MPLGKPSGRPQAVPGKKQSASGAGSDRRISNRPSDAESGGGAPDNVDAEILLAEATTFDYGGKYEPIPALHVQFKIEGHEQVQDQYYSAGDLSRLVPLEDGSAFAPAEGSSANGLNDSSNVYLFMVALHDHGFPDDKMDDFHNLEGLVGHLNAVAPKKKREGLEGGNKPIAVFTKIHKMPWEQAKGKGQPSTTSRGASTPSKASASSANGDSDLNTECINAIVTLLGENDNTLPAKNLGMAVFKSNPKNPQRAAMLKHIADKSFFNQDDLPFVSDGETVTMLE